MGSLYSSQSIVYQALELQEYKWTPMTSLICFCGKLPMTWVKSSTLQSTSTYQILGGTERESKASISWSVVPETAPCPDFTLAFCDWGHTVMYFLRVVTPSYERVQVWCGTVVVCVCVGLCVRAMMTIFLVFTLCCRVCYKNVNLQFNNTVPQTYKYTVMYITCADTHTHMRNVCQTWCRGLSFSCKNTSANWPMHHTYFHTCTKQATRRRRAQGTDCNKLRFDMFVSFALTSLLKRAVKPIALSASQPKQTTKGPVRRGKKNKLTELAVSRHRHKHCWPLLLAAECLYFLPNA